MMRSLLRNPAGEFAVQVSFFIRFLNANNHASLSIVMQGPARQIYLKYALIRKINDASHHVNITVGDCPQPHAGRGCIMVLAIRCGQRRF